MKLPERVLVVYSGHNSSTLDLSNYIATGMGHAGAVVKRFRYDNEIRIAYDACEGWSKRSDTYKMTALDPIYIASKALLADIVMFRPDLVLVVTGLLLYGNLWLWLREFQEQLKQPFVTGLLLTESPYQVEEELHCAAMANIIWTNERAFVPALRRLNPRSYWLPHAYEASVHFRARRNPEFDVYFCGTGKPARMQLIAETDWSGVNLRLEGMFVDLVKTWPHMQDHYVDGLVPNAEATERCRRSRICLNKHRREGTKVLYRHDSDRDQVVEMLEVSVTDEEATCVNDRCIQIAACGSFQLCDSGRTELAEVFGESVPTYSSSEELRDRVRFYLTHEDERERLADMAYERIRHRTYQANAATILRQIAEDF